MPGAVMPAGLWWLVGLAALAAAAGWVLARRRSRNRAEPAIAEPAAPRTLLGRYRVERTLGRGAMGTVVLCHDPQRGRAVAIKTLPLAAEFEAGELAQARDRFFREAAMAGRLQHPDIVAVLDAGEADGVACIVMEVIDGHDLFRHTQPGRLLPVPDVLRIMARVAAALAHAHRQGVVHRDVKPANVMVDARTGSVKVTDFGIARIADARRTRTGLLLGTPSFMSPEQVAGLPLDGRSDLYSAGVMLFQMLTGALPHTAEAMGPLLKQITTEPARDVRSLRPELPEALAGIVARALAKRADDRYADGDRLCADLNALAHALEAADRPAREQVQKGAAGDVGFGPAAGDSRTDPRHNLPD